MQIYLPIAEMSVNVLLVLGMGGVVGFLSGLFGVGGGFLLTPLLILYGVPPAVAVGTQANQIVASSIAGVLAHMRRGNVDFKMGFVLLVGGLVGSGVGVWLFALLRRLGQIDLAISLSYVIFLGSVGGLMFVESASALLKRRRSPGGSTARGPGRHTWMHGLPLKMRFRRSKLYISAILPLLIGFMVGILAAIMGVGGGFVMVPAMIYLLGMPTQVVIGTSLFQIIFVAASTAMLQAAVNQTVDVVLALLLLAGAVVGAQIGAKVGARLRGEQLRVLLAAMVLLVCIKLAFDLMSTPSEIFSFGALPMD
ncbi:MAG: sulfite exporter TauE/SafE family protein [Rhodospirillum sp.]|nr:sulfite exporter TauE/SafE family protein [Rhodospirillum sp.]MCF8490860.1 sulfite exporter TauE/SafE family protein [Rhodospirillum sp.]MCF8502774.1 sulfite exporter TauE/SafE family protein [Rhodospirillum sp.]